MMPTTQTHTGPNGQIVPIIHINGTSKRELLELRMAVIDALLTAGKALAAMAPHGRDYYPRGDDALRQAQSQHARRLCELRNLTFDITEECDAIGPL